MRIQVRIPKVKPDVYPIVERSPYTGCGGRRFKEHGQQAETKPMRDLNDAAVESYRYECLTCGRTFGCIPKG